MSNQITLTPSAVNKYLKSIIEGDKFLKQFLIEGEISNLKYHSNQNIYFSIKDNDAAIDCIMFKNYAKNLNIELKEGMKIEITGSIYLYLKMGKYNINVSNIKVAGAGDLYQNYLLLKEKLQKEGLFNLREKKKITKFPETIGVITSPTSAAVCDIVTTINRRYKIAKIIIIPSLVQGELAAKNIASQIKLANKLKICDTLIVGRGGGSIEDLWAFNEEIVARAVYDSEIPIISCVGHESDTTIIDYVADMRAPTPTAAAELATSDSQQLEVKNAQRVKNIISILSNKLSLANSKLETIEQNQYFKNPLLTVSMSFKQLDDEFIKECNAFNLKLTNKNHQISSTIQELINQINNDLIKKKIQLTTMHERLDTLNPLSILSRGYALTKVDNKIIKSINDVVLDKEMVIEFVDGKVSAIPIRKDENERKKI